MNTNTHDTRDRSRGFTLVELMIVATLTGFLLIMLSGMWRAFGGSLIETSAQARLLCEADLAVETLRRDFGGHLPGSDTGNLETGRLLGRLVLAGGTQLMLCYDGPPANGAADWAAPDTVVKYEVQDGQLLRVNQTTGSVFVVSDGVELFSVVDDADGVTIELNIRQRNLSRAYEFVVKDP